MKHILTLLLSFYFIVSYASLGDSIVIVKKKEIYPLMDDCNDSIVWEEIRMHNSAIQNKINSEIYNRIQHLKVDSIYFESVCAEEIFYESNSTIVYAQNNLVSIFFKRHLIYPNQKNMMSIQTVNYCSKTGDTISFQELFKSDKQTAIDSIIISEVKKWYEEFEMDFGNDELVYTLEQIKNAQFSIEDTRIILYLSAVHCAYCTDEDPAVFFDYTEYKNYFNPKGVLKSLLKKQLAR